MVNIVGTHQEGRTDDDVTGLSIYNQRGLSRFPGGIAGFFPNLAAIDWVFGDLTSISRSDLEPFPELRFLTLFGNQLTSLEDGLFQSSTNLEYVDLGNNLVRNVASDLFTGLTELRWVFFQRNPCIDIIAATPEAIQELSALLVGQCPASVGVTIECEFVELNWSGLEELYTCVGTIVGNGSASNVINVVGTHIEGRSNDDVRGLSISNQRGLTQLPSNIGGFFNLAGLSWTFGDLNFVSADDLSQEPKASIISFYGNHLTTLEGNLFQSTPALRQIDLGNNLIRNVGNGVFNNLTELRAVLLQRNPCIDTIAATPEAIEGLSAWLVSQCPAAEGLTIVCSYSDANWAGIEDFYTCHGTIVGNSSASTIINVVGTHISGRSNADIRGFSIYNQRGLTQLPSNINVIFPSLRAVDWVFGDLNSVSRDDLRQFSDLAILSLYGNRLTSLDGDLFQNNRRLQQIDLGNNLIQNAGTGLFDHLAELRIVLFQRNPCIDSVAGTPEAIEELILQLASQCPATIGVTVECTYSDEIWAGIDTFYTCIGSIVGNGSASNIVNIVGIHLEGRSNADVTGFSIVNQRGLSRIPGNTNNFFPNIRAFDWIFGDLNEVSAINLQQFANVEILSLYGNRLTALDGNLFQNTRNLQQVDLGNNLIEAVGEGIFNNLTELRSVLIQRNPCVDTIAATPEAIQELTETLLRQCSAAAGLTIQCEFRVVNWAGIVDLYTCFGTIIGSGGGSNIVNVVGTHPDGFSNDDVLGLSIYNQRGLTQLPGNFNNFFSSLTAVDWVFGDLTTVGANNLAQFSNATILNLYGNRLTTLNGNLFQGNRALEVIDLGNNLINDVGPGLLNNLPQLRTVFFQRNACVDFIASTPQGIQELNALLRDRCSPGGPPGECPAECLARIDNLESRIVVLESALTRLLNLP